MPQPSAGGQPGGAHTGLHVYSTQLGTRECSSRWAACAGRAVCIVRVSAGLRFSFGPERSYEVIVLFHVSQSGPGRRGGRVRLTIVFDALCSRRPAGAGWPTCGGAGIVCVLITTLLCHMARRPPRCRP